MSQPASPRDRLEESSEPTAFVHEGLFVYANRAFLERLGFDSLEELQLTPLLNLVPEGQREGMRSHLIQARKTPEDQIKLPELLATLLRQNGKPLKAKLRSHAYRFEDEDCIRVYLQTEQDARLGSRIRRLPWRFYLSAVLLIALMVLPLLLLLRLDINNAPKVYIPDDSPAVVIDDRLRETFPNDQVLFLLFEGVALFSDGFLTAFHDLGERILAHPLVDDVLTVTRQDHISGSEDGFSINPIVDTQALDEKRPKERLEFAIADRFARGVLVAADGSALGMVVIPHAVDNSLERLELQNYVVQAVEDSRLSGYFTALAGQIPLDVAELRTMLLDNMIFIPATVIIGLSLIWWLFRRLLAVLLSALVIGVIVSCTVAFYVIADQPFTLISSIIPPLLSALTIAALVHLFNALHYAAMRGYSGRKRIEHALQEIRRPALFTALTTAVGLASLGTSPIGPVAVFGLTSAVGVMLIYLVVIHVVPVLLVRLDSSPWPSTEGSLIWMDRFLRVLFHTGLRHPIWVIGIVSAALLAGTPYLFKVEAETSLQEFFSPGHPIRQDTDYIQEKLSGTTSLELVIETDEVDGLKDPRILELMRDFQRWAETQPEVDRTFSPADFIEEMHWGFHGEDPSYRRIPDNPALISQYLFVYDGNDLFDFVDQDFRYAHINLSVNVHRANAISEVMDRMREWMREHAGEDVRWEIAGAGRLFADMDDLLVQGQVYSLWGALALIMLLMILLWRSLWDSLLCMIPNLSPVLLIFIIMGAAGIWLDMATAMIASVAVGIAVDDTIHVYHGFRHRLANGVPVLTAIVRSYRQAGRAVMITTIILSAQFMILVTSQFVPTTHFGLLTSIGLIAAFLFDLLLFPAILILIHGKRRKPPRRRRTGDARKSRPSPSTAEATAPSSLP